jgi:hypothetical protein
MGKTNGWGRARLMILACAVGLGVVAAGQPILPRDNVTRVGSLPRTASRSSGLRIHDRRCERWSRES